MLGDAELEKRASALFDDPIARQSYELQVALAPGDEAAAEDLAIIVKR
jgi:hypothetical protein